MKPDTPMQVLLREMPTERSFALEPDFIREALSGAPGQNELEGEAVEKPGEVVVELSFTEENGSVFARGTVRGWVNVACSRCVEAMRLDVDETIQTTYLPQADARVDEEVEPDDEFELNEDDLDVSTHDGERVDLADVLRDQLVLAVPFAPLCSQDCTGIPGSDAAGWTFKTEEQAKAEPKPEDPRFAVLKNLKLD